jgi:RNA polymerase sigma-70 factor (ECF subfamily)
MITEASGDENILPPSEIAGLSPDTLFVRLYDELRALARWHLESERGDHTLQSTALVHEAYLRLSIRYPSPWGDRHHFLSTAAKVMRQILVDHARTRNRLKRGGAAERIALSEIDAAFEAADPIDIQAVDAALNRLAELDARQAQIVELRFFAGMTVPETAAVLHLSPETVKRDWTMARAWLSRALRAS